MQFRFANPIICHLTAGYKVIRVGNSAPFGFDVGDALYVLPGMEIDINLGAATPQTPIECDCIEIEAGRIDSIMAQLTENLSTRGQDASVTLNWETCAVFTGDEADSLRLGGLMAMFSGKHDLFTDARIEARIDETVLTVLQLRSDDLLVFDRVDPDFLELANGTCAENGLLIDPVSEGVGVTSGLYGIRFGVGEFYRQSGLDLPQPSFIEDAVFRFGIDRVTEHFHLPFKFTPWGFSLFRGGA